MASTTRVIISRGEARAIYSDGMAPYLQLLGAEVKRASHVEPDNEHRHGGNWYIDLSPLGVFDKFEQMVGDSKHYVDDEGKPFLTREAALAFEKVLVERLWLHQAS